MDQPKDEQITCASCGSSFPFTAADAAARAERGHTSPPTLCKACWRARKGKSDAARREPRPAQRDARAPRATRTADARPPQRPRYSGDVNEYRSPMPDPHFGTHAPPLRAPARPARDEGPRAPALRREGEGGAAFRPAQRNTRERGFPITCAACGQAASVPFRPAPGQKVYCRTCFRADKPT